MEKKNYIQPEMKMLKSYLAGDIANEFGVSQLSGEGPVVIGEGDQDDDVDPTSNNNNVFDPWSSDPWNVWN